MSNTPIFGVALPTCLLHNKKTDRWHFIIFRWAPRPSGYDEPVQRYKSKAHHTDGFDTKEEAIAEIKRRPESFIYHEEMIYEWDGEDIPACTGYFAEPEMDVTPNAKTE